MNCDYILIETLQEISQRIPDGWTIQLLFWKNNAVFALEDPNGQHVETIDLLQSSMHLAAMIEKCVAYAIEHDASY